MNGSYPPYTESMFKKLNVKLDIKDGDLELIKNNPCDYLGISYYMSNIIKADEKGNAIGNMS